MSLDDDDDFTDEDDESDGDDADEQFDRAERLQDLMYAEERREREYHDYDNDTGLTGDHHATEEKEMDEKKTTEKPATPKAPPARRAPMGLMGAHPMAQTAKPAVMSAKPTIQTAVPPQAENVSPSTKLTVEFTEAKFAAFLAKSGLNADGFAAINPAKVATLVQKWANEAIETGVSPAEAWTAAITKLSETASTKLSNKELDEAEADKLQTVAKYFLEALTEAQKAMAKPAAPKVEPAKKATAEPKTQLGIAPPAAPVKKVEPKVEPVVEAPKVPCPKCGKENAGTYNHCLSCGSSLKAEPVKAQAKKPVTDPHAATEVGTPMPGSSRVSSGDGGRTTVTPEQEAMVAAAAAAIKDEQSVSVSAPLPPAPDKQACIMKGERVGTPIPKSTPNTAQPTGFVPPADITAPPAATELPKSANADEQPKAGKITKLQAATLFLAAAALAILVWEFVLPKLMSSNAAAQPAAVQPAAPAAEPVITAPTSVSETCAKVTPALLQKYYSQGDPSKFRYEKKSGVRMSCNGKTIYKDPTTNLYDVRPCDICYSR